MTYNILIVKNRYFKKLILNKYLDWFKTHTPLTVTTEELYTDFDVTTQPVSNGTYTGVICHYDIVAKLRTVIPENKYHAVVFVYGNNLNGIRVSVCNGENGQYPLYPNTELIQLVKLTDNGQTLNHEMFHGFLYKAKRFGAPVIDTMDTYLQDKNMNTVGVITNRTQCITQLAPYWNVVTSFMNIQNSLPTVTITRSKVSKYETIGSLEATMAGARFTCDTLELPWANNLKNISAIPTGIYQVKYTFSPKFLKSTYEIQEVPNRSGIRIHSANYFSDLLGCIALGSGTADINNDGQLDVINSRNTITAFEAFMKKASFVLIIK